MIDKNDPRLTDFVLGELDAQQQAEIQSQIDQNPELDAAVQELRRTVELIGDAYNFESPLQLSAAQKDELQVELAPTVSSDKTTRSSHLNRYVIWALAVCVTGLMVGSTFWYLQTTSPLAPSVALFDAASTTSEAAPIAMRKDLAKGGVDSESLEPLAEQIAEIEELASMPGKSEELDPFPAKLSLEVRQSQQLVENGISRKGADESARQQEVENLSMIVEELPNRARQSAQLGAEIARAEPRQQLQQHFYEDEAPMVTAPRNATKGLQGPADVAGRFPVNNESYDEASGSTEFLAGGEIASEITSELAFDDRRTSDLDFERGIAQGRRGEQPSDLGRGLAEAGDGKSGGMVRGLGGLGGLARGRGGIGGGKAGGGFGGLGGSGRGGGGGGFAPSEPIPSPAPAGRFQHPMTENALATDEEHPEPANEPELAQAPARALVLSPEISERLARSLAEQVDPAGTKEIRIAGQTQQQLERNSRRGKQLDVGIITLKGDEEGLREVEKQIRQLADHQGIEAKDQDNIQWQGQIQRALDLRNANIRRANTWKRVKAVPNATRLMIGDDDELELNGMQVNVQVDGFRARVLIDCFFYNDRDQQLEGNFKLRLPDDASLYYFAFGESAYEYKPETDWAKNEFQKDEFQFVSLQPEQIRNQRRDDWANCKEARMVPREKAAFAYNQTMRKKVDPALVEWSGAGVFNARVFPLSPKKMHRIVMGYDVNLIRTADGWNFQLDLPEQTGECQVALNVQDIDGLQARIQPKAASSKIVQIDLGSQGPVVGKAALGQQATVTQYRYANPQAKSIQLKFNRDSEVALTGGDERQGEFWGLQLAPELPAEEFAANPRAIFLLDTSLSSNPDKFNVWLKLLKATLENNRDSLKEFNVLFFDVGSAFWRDGYVANTAEITEALLKECENITLEGATDLFGAIEKITTSKWVHDKKRDGPDLFLLSDGAVNWGETNVRLLKRQLTDNRLGSLFAYQTGLTGTAIANLRFLANDSGGAVFSVATEDEIDSASTAHRNRPWKLVDVSAVGTSDVLTAGRVEWVYPGQSLTVVGRGKPKGQVNLELKQGNQIKTVSVKPRVVESELASRLYGQVAVGQLEALGSKTFDVAASYARHFRVTGSTCSLLMLETEAEYERFGIKPQEDLFVIKSRNAGSLIDETIKQFATQLADPKAQLIGWLRRLESMPGMEFKIPTAMELALGELQVEAISQPLDCDPRDNFDSPAEFVEELSKQELDYDVIAAESKRRVRKSVDESIKVLSNLIERNPGDLEIARDVAFTALELDRPAQAYPLLLAVAKARPYQASVYPAIGQCLTQLGQADMAIMFYEVALNASFDNRGEDFRKILAAEYLHLLRQVTDGKLATSVPEYVKARQQTLKETLGFESADLLITMMWNTDQTDVDLHVKEPSGEVCSYQNKDTRIGGHITRDITTGFGPEMYTLPDAMKGKYDVSVNLFGNRQSRTKLRNKVHLTVFKDFGKPTEQVRRKTIELQKIGALEQIKTIGIE